MTHQSLESLRRRLADLGGLRQHAHGFVHIKVFTASESVPEERWPDVAGLGNYSGHVLFPRSKDSWLEPSLDGRFCIRWQGKDRAVKEFQRWADEAAATLAECGHTLPEPGYQGGIRLLCSMALGNAKLSHLAEGKVVADNRSSYPHRERLLAQGWPNKIPKVHLTSIQPDAVTFAVEVIDHLIGSPPSLSGIVDLPNNSIVIKGKTYDLGNRIYALVLDVLAAARGEVRSRNDILTAYPELKKERIDRRIKEINKKKPPLSDVIKTKPKRGYFIHLGDLE